MSVQSYTQTEREAGIATFAELEDGKIVTAAGKKITIWIRNEDDSTLNKVASVWTSTQEIVAICSVQSYSEDPEFASIALDGEITYWQLSSKTKKIKQEYRMKTLFPASTDFQGSEMTIHEMGKRKIAFPSDMGIVVDNKLISMISASFNALMKFGTDQIGWISGKDIHIWDGKNVRSLKNGHSRKITALCQLQDKYFATADQKSMKIWRARSAGVRAKIGIRNPFEHVATFPTDSEVTTLVHVGHQKMAGATKKRQVIIWDHAQKTIHAQFTMDTVATKLIPLRAGILGCQTANTIEIWKWDEGAPRRIHLINDNQGILSKVSQSEEDGALIISYLGGTKPIIKHLPCLYSNNGHFQTWAGKPSEKPVITDMKECQIRRLSSTQVAVEGIHYLGIWNSNIKDWETLLVRKQDKDDHKDCFIHDLFNGMFLVHGYYQGDIQYGSKLDESKLYNFQAHHKEITDLMVLTTSIFVTCSKRQIKIWKCNPNEQGKKSIHLIRKIRWKKMDGGTLHRINDTHFLAYNGRGFFQFDHLGKLVCWIKCPKSKPSETLRLPQAFSDGTVFMGGSKKLERYSFLDQQKQTFNVLTSRIHTLSEGCDHHTCINDDFHKLKIYQKDGKRICDQLVGKPDQVLHIHPQWVVMAKEGTLELYHIESQKVIVSRKHSEKSKCTKMIFQGENTLVYTMEDQNCTSVNLWDLSDWMKQLDDDENGTMSPMHTSSEDEESVTPEVLYDQVPALMDNFNLFDDDDESSDEEEDSTVRTEGDYLDIPPLRDKEVE